MRVISGTLRGREVRLPKGSRIRPATGFVREMLMSIYTPARLAGGAFLDLCAGSGLVGFEALSRGGPAAYFVEVDAQTAGALKENAARFDVAEQVAVLRCDARRCMPRVAETAVKRGERIACAFLDAPYIPGMAADVLARIAGALESPEVAAAFLPECVLIARSPDELPAELPTLKLVVTRKASQDRLWIYRLQDPH